ncbi:hypothetical protein HDU99_003511 [Rhizoclosmatium hyalinum]|nr:hypothetical protein HDU99_003511 [Rhizoclosmatium hyalinum]
MNDPKKLKSVKPKSRKRSKRDVVDESESEEMMDDGDGVNDSEDEEIVTPRRTYKTRSSAKKKRQEHNKFTSINDLDTSEIDGDELVILLSDYEE